MTRYAVFHGTICTAREDGSIPLNSRIVAELGRNVDLDPSPLLDRLIAQVNAAPAAIAALRLILPLAEAYLAGAPGHPDQAKLESARAALAAWESIP